MSFALRRRNVDLRNWMKVKRLPNHMLKLYKSEVGRPGFEESQKIVPFEYGKLASTGRYRETQKGFTITYGTAYAGIQHADLSFEHPGKESILRGIQPPGERMALYVEIPIREGTKAFLRFTRRFFL